jgi:hypothetical protein
MRLLLIALTFLISPQFQANSQTRFQEEVTNFLEDGSFIVTTVQQGVVKEIAVNVELPGRMPSQLFWQPGKDIADEGAGEFNSTSAIYVTDEKNLFLVLMIPSSMKPMNIKLERIESSVLIGELMIPEYMFYDPQNPPVLPPKTYVHLTKAALSIGNLFTEEILQGEWEVTNAEGCSFPVPTALYLLDNGAGQSVTGGNETYLAWKRTPGGGYVFLDFYLDEFSESVSGILINDNLISGVSSLTNCRFTIMRK